MNLAWQTVRCQIKSFGENFSNPLASLQPVPRSEIAFNSVLAAAILLQIE